MSKMSRRRTSYRGPAKLRANVLLLTNESVAEARKRLEELREDLAELLAYARELQSTGRWGPRDFGTSQQELDLVFSEASRLRDRIAKLETYLDSTVPLPSGQKSSRRILANESTAAKILKLEGQLKSLLVISEELKKEGVSRSEMNVIMGRAGRLFREIEELRKKQSPRTASMTARETSDILQDDLLRKKKLRQRVEQEIAMIDASVRRGQITPEDAMTKKKALLDILTQGPSVGLGRKVRRNTSRRHRLHSTRIAPNVWPFKGRPEVDEPRPDSVASSLASESAKALWIIRNHLKRSEDERGSGTASLHGTLALYKAMEELGYLRCQVVHVRRLRDQAYERGQKELGGALDWAFDSCVNAWVDAQQLINYEFYKMGIGDPRYNLRIQPES